MKPSVSDIRPIMNSLVIVLSILAAVSVPGFCLQFKLQNFTPQVIAQPPQGDGKGPRGPPGPPMPGCENPPENPPKMSDCCADFPKFYSKEVMKTNCSATCGDAKGPASFCCKSDCMLNTFGVLTDGKFDAAKAKAAIAQLTAGNTKWTTDVRVLS